MTGKFPHALSLLAVLGEDLELQLSKTAQPTLSAIVASFAVGWLMLALSAGAAELELLTARFAVQDLELSGLVFVDGDLYAVADDSHQVFRVEWEGAQRFKFVPTIDLDRIEQFRQYRLQAKVVAKEKGLKEWLDLEGIAHCPGGRWFLVNERLRDVFLLHPGMRFEVLSWSKDLVPDLFDGGANAGLEGVAVDCANNLLYLAKEREPRFILEMPLRNPTMLRRMSMPPSQRAGQRVIDFRGGPGLIELADDISDMTFTDGHLYILERNTYEVAKVSVREGKVLARHSFFKTAANLYDNDEPYGLAESLSVEQGKIHIGFDNNHRPLSASAAQQWGVSGAVPAILTYRRPPGF